MMKSRRKFLQTSVTALGAGSIVSPMMAQKIHPPIVEDGLLPLNDLLVEYRETEPKFGHGLALTRIDSLEKWENKRQSILTRAKMMLGEPPTIDPALGKVEVIAEVERAKYREVKVSFPSGSGDFINGFLLLPHGMSSDQQRPAILAMHSTGPGATQTIGLTPKENREYGKELANRGYVVLVIDVISAGERVYPSYSHYYTNAFYEKFPEWSAMGKMISDHQKGLDYLCSLPYVDNKRLGCIGHSLGGYNAFFLQAFDHRIKAAVTSCGLSTLGGTKSPYQFARGDWFVHFNPRSRYFLQSGMVPCDMHEIMALCAPRALFNFSARQDGIYCNLTLTKQENYQAWWQTIDQALTQVDKVYEIHGHPSQFVRKEMDGGHDFPWEIRSQAFDWLDQQLNWNH